MDRFLNSLHKEIQDVVELEDYHFFEKLVHQATKVEKQIQMRVIIRKSYQSDLLTKVIGMTKVKQMGMIISLNLIVENVLLKEI